MGRILQRLSPFKRPEKVPGNLILVRAGDSIVKDNLIFTGWIDVDLSDRGTKQVLKAAELIMMGGYTVDVVYTSRLKRAIRSAWTIMKEIDQIYRPVYKSWR